MRSFRLETQRQERSHERDWVGIPVVGVLWVALAIWAGGAAAVLIGLAWFVPVMVAIALGASRKRTGWAWGFFLGWLGVLILACMRSQPEPAA